MPNGCEHNQSSVNAALVLFFGLIMMIKQFELTVFFVTSNNTCDVSLAFFQFKASRIFILILKTSYYLGISQKRKIGK